MEWSDGVYRLLNLIISAKVPFQTESEILPPSLVLIDEVENGLDFRTLKFIIRYLQENSDDTQIVITSHSPLVCDFVHPGDWIVAKKKGYKVNYISPAVVEKEMEKQLELFKQEHWQFYSKHICNSLLYKVK